MPYVFFLVDVSIKLSISLIPFSFGVWQLLVHRVLFRLFPPVESTSSHTISLEKLSFENLKSYLDKNPDCSRCVVLLSVIILFHVGHRIIFCGQSYLEGFGLLYVNFLSWSRLRASMEGFLDAYDPCTSATPAGVFVNRVEVTMQSSSCSCTNSLIKIFRHF